MTLMFFEDKERAELSKIFKALKNLPGADSGRVAAFKKVYSSLL